MILLKRLTIVLLPWFVLSVVTRHVPPQWGAVLWIAFIALGALRSRMAKRPLNPLPFAAIVTILGLTANGYLRFSTWASENGSALCYAAFAVTALVTVLLRAPFSVAYAKAMVPAALWSHPIFLRVNNNVSLVWTLVFALNAVINASVHEFWIAQPTSFALLAAAIVYSDVYPSMVRLRYQTHLQA